MTETPENDTSAATTTPSPSAAPVETTPAASEVASAPAPTASEVASAPAPTATEAVASEVDASASSAPDEAPTSDADAAAASGDGPDAGASDAAAEAPSGEGASSEAAADGTSGDPTKKKRRRRRKKKGEARADGEGGEAPVEARPARERKDNAPPFQRFIEARAMGEGRRGAFSVGEHVGGRVVAIVDGAATIDLFGKGVAYASQTESRDIPVAFEADAEERDNDHANDDQAPASQPGSVGAAAAHLEGSVGMPGSESLPPPPPPSGASPAHVVANLDNDDVPGADSDPAHVGEAAWHLRRVGTPLEHEAPDDAPGSELPPPIPSASKSARPSATADDNDDDAPDGAAQDETEHPPLVLGDIFRGRVAAVSESGHLAIHNRLVTRAEARARLTKARDERRRVFGLVFGFNRGGFDVLVEGVRAFCPVSGLAIEHVEDPEQHLGRRVEFSVQQAKSGNQGIVVSRRSILEKEARKRGRDLRRSLKAGQKLEGRVTQVRDFGVFVDLGGIEGLVHMSELSYDRSVRPNDAAKPGDVVRVQVLKVTEPTGRKDRDGRISLSIKALLDDPWESNLGDVSEGVACKGKVTRATEFGAFVEIAPNVEGLLHISELGRDLKHASERVKAGEDIYIVVERIDTKARRISLSKLTDEEAKLFEEGQLTTDTGGKSTRPGAHLKVKVERVEGPGLHVQVEGVLGRRGRGFIPNVEMGTERGTDHRKKFPPGTEIDVKVIGLDRDGGLRCSRKALVQDEERRAIQDYRRDAARKGFGTFGDLLRNKIENLGADKK